jgi:ABC-type hemin transport system substrate-binding protein
MKQSVNTRIRQRMQQEEEAKKLWESVQQEAKKLDTKSQKATAPASQPLL